MIQLPLRTRLLLSRLKHWGDFEGFERESSDLFKREYFTDRSGDCAINALRILASSKSGELSSSNLPPIPFRNDFDLKVSLLAVNAARGSFEANLKKTIFSDPIDRLTKSILQQAMVESADLLLFIPRDRAVDVVYASRQNGTVQEAMRVPRNLQNALWDLLTALSHPCVTAALVYELSEHRENRLLRDVKIGAMFPESNAFDAEELVALMPTLSYEGLVTANGDPKVMYDRTIYVNLEFEESASSS